MADAQPRCIVLAMTVAALVVQANALAAQSISRDLLVLPRLNGPVTLDGRSDEPAWHLIDPLPLIMYEPTYGGTPTERTEPGRFYDTDPSGIRVNSLYRDRWSGDDTFGIVIDAFNDNENALSFWATPAGVRGDESLSNDAEGDANSSWNTYWDVATVITPKGWFGEMRIPFSSLGFQDNEGRVVMGFAVYRFIARKNERQLFPDIPADWNFEKPSLAQDALLEGVTGHNPVYFTPYALGGVGQAPELDAPSGTFLLENSLIREVGADVKYNVTSNLTLDLSVNTDFAQIEADDQLVNLTRFPLFFPEKRQFFQERAGIFQFNTGGSDRLFHSRRIGLHEGAQIPIYGGARLVGRVGQWDLGFLDMQTAERGGSPSENFGVLRVRRQAFNPYSYAGGMVTSRVGTDGSYNLAYGLDGVFRVFGDEYLTLKWAQTFDDSMIDANGFRFGDAGMLFASWQRRRQEGIIYNATVRRAGADYRPQLGFLTRRDFTELSGTVRYSRFLPETAYFRRVSPFEVRGSATLRNADRTVESGSIEPSVTVEWKSGASLAVWLAVDYEDLRRPLSLPENTAVPPESYWFYNVGAAYDMAQGGLFRSAFVWGMGSFYDGWTTLLGAEPRWNLSRHFELSGEYQAHFVRFSDRGQGFDLHIGRLRAQLAFDSKASVAAFAQYDSDSEIVSTNVRFRYNFREGNDLWVVYNEGIRAELGDPRLPRTDNRTVMVKYTYTFRW